MPAHHVPQHADWSKLCLHMTKWHGRFGRLSVSNKQDGEGSDTYFYDH